MASPGACSWVRGAKGGSHLAWLEGGSMWTSSVRLFGRAVCQNPLLIQHWMARERYFIAIQGLFRMGAI